MALRFLRYIMCGPIIPLILIAFFTACAHGESETEDKGARLENRGIKDMVTDVVPNDPLIDNPDAGVTEKEIGSCTTPLLNRHASRVNNIRVASEELNGKTIEPGQEFSLNETLGRRTREKGYKLAPIFIRRPDGTSNGYGVGGGICQVSSTLYGAVLEADLEVTERHPHSKRVKYVQPGRDAMVVYGKADLKFINNRDNAVVIKTKLEDEQLTIRILEKTR
jgi:vancomycin resistance protein YoaR